MVLAASIVGSGELIATTTLGAQVGFAVLWIILVSCAIKPVVQGEFGRYTIATGHTALEGFNRVPGPRLGVNWLIWAWALMVSLTLLQVGGMLSPNGIALMNMYPEPTAGFQQGANNSIFNSDNPQDQRKDNLRFDYRLNKDNQITYRYSKYNWVAIDAFRGTFPFARTDWDRPNSTQNINWTRTFGGNLINEFSYSYSIDQVFINVFTESGLYKRSRTGINYPYIFPDRKEISDKIPSVTVDSFTRIDGGPYPSSSEGPIHERAAIAVAQRFTKRRQLDRGGT